MSDSCDSLDKRVERAVALLLVAPVLMIPQVIKALNFTPDESADQTTQMKVRRALRRAREKCEDTTAHTPPPVSVVGVGPTPTTAVSTLSTNTSIRAPKLKLARTTAAAKQQKLTNKLLKECG